MHHFELKFYLNTLCFENDRKQTKVKLYKTAGSIFLVMSSIKVYILTGNVVITKNRFSVCLAKDGGAAPKARHLYRLEFYKTIKQYTNKQIYTNMLICLKIYMFAR